MVGLIAFLFNQVIPPGLLDVLLDHPPHQLIEGDFRLPAQRLLGLGAVAQQKLDFRGPEIPGIDLDPDFAGSGVPADLLQAQGTEWCVAPDGRLDMGRPLSAFQEFFREHSERWVERFDCKEAGPRLPLQALLQRAANSGGRIEREYGPGRGRTDLQVVWPFDGGVQKVVIELKLLRKSLEKTVAEGFVQTAGHMDRCGFSEGRLVIFDRTGGRSWEEKISDRLESVDSREIRGVGGCGPSRWFLSPPRQPLQQRPQLRKLIRLRDPAPEAPLLEIGNYRVGGVPA